MIASLDMNINNLKAQDYDGVSNVLGLCSGVSSIFQKECPPALRRHCLCHSLSISASSASTVPRSAKGMIDVCLEIARLIKISLKRERKLGKII